MLITCQAFSLYLQVLSQVELNDIWKYADEMTKRGKHLAVLLKL